MKRILIVNSFYFPTIIGGAEISTQLLAEELANQYEVHVLTTGEHKNNIVTDVINNVTVHRIPCLNIYSPLDRKNKGAIRKTGWHIINAYHPYQASIIRNLVKKIDPDIVHSQNLMGIGTYLWNICNYLSIPIVHTTRDYALVEPVNSNIINKLVYKCNLRRSRKVNHIVGISRYILNYHDEKKLFSNAKKSVIGNIVNAKQFKRNERKNKTPLSIGYFGQVAANKGVMTLVKAIQHLKEDIVKELVICGTGDLIEEIQKITQNDKRIIIKGKISQDEVYRQMAQVDVTVVPSIWAEPFGRVIIESYQQGTPVIATNVGGIPELITDSKMLFEPEKIEELQHKLEWLQTMSENKFKELVEDSYENSKKFRSNISYYEKVYSELLKN
ncbi:glycosyltransferase family 4 protein [Priestia megaterium]|uniref:glycosyltransferase family 4 protein n=1 Tax=Priestia megaterium TaxID=1404 RepID=UPI0012B7BE9F|nr:glycosyltransferase family 4 protein [Priestia megaterium]